MYFPGEGKVQKNKFMSEKYPLKKIAMHMLQDIRYKISGFFFFSLVRAMTKKGLSIDRSPSNLMCSRPRLFKRWIALSTGSKSIQWIAQLVSLILICWISM